MNGTNMRALNSICKRTSIYRRFQGGGCCSLLAVANLKRGIKFVFFLCYVKKILANYYILLLKF